MFQWSVAAILRKQVNATGNMAVRRSQCEWVAKVGLSSEENQISVERSMR